MNPHLMKLLGLAVACWLAGAMEVVFAQDNAGARTISGSVQNQDLRRGGQALVEGREQEGTIVAHKVTNDAGEVTVAVPAEGTEPGSAVLRAHRSAELVAKIGDA